MVGGEIGTGLFSPQQSFMHLACIQTQEHQGLARNHVPLPSAVKPGSRAGLGSLKPASQDLEDPVIEAGISALGLRSAEKGSPA